MLDPAQTSLGRHSPGNEYPNIHVGGEARVILENTYNTSDKDLLSCLPVVENAAFNSHHRQQERTCLEGTRVELLRLISQWADGTGQQRIFWLTGMAGTGKSTIAKTIAYSYAQQQRLAASFFFSQGGGDASNARKFATTIAVQLAQHVPETKPHICYAIERNSTIMSQSLMDQWSELIISPLSKLDGPSPPYIIVVDALDECENEIEAGIILKILAQWQFLESRVRFLITSRPAVHMRFPFYYLSEAERTKVILHDIETTIVDRDISIYLTHELRRIGDKQMQSSTPWPDDSVVSRLTKKSFGWFIWAATTSRFIDAGDGFAEERLSEIVDESVSDATPEQQLNQLYLSVLNSSLSNSLREQEKTQRCLQQRRILACLVISFAPHSVASLGRLLDIPERKVQHIIGKLHAILYISKHVTPVIRLHHPSFREFLVNKRRCSDENFWVDEGPAHGIIATQCIQLMSKTLRRDACQMHAPGTLIIDVGTSRVEQYLPLELRYACLYWNQHLQKSNIQLNDNDDIHSFLRQHLLHWLEALAWLGRTSDAILTIISLETKAQAGNSPTLYRFLHDTKRFVLYHRATIEQAPLQLYCSALVFSPEQSIVRRHFADSIPNWFQNKPKVQPHWNGALQTLKGHSGWVRTVTFSPDGKSVASGSDDNTVRLWDAATGAVLQTLKGPEAVNTVAFSPDGKSVVSGSDHSTVWLEDAGTGALLQPLEGHSGCVYTVAFSPDGKSVASGSDDSTVRLWDAATGAALQTLKGHSDAVYTVAFSPDGKLVASGSSDSTIRLWDAATGAVLETLEGHSKPVNIVAFSPDGKSVVSGSDDSTVWLWDAATGASLRTLKGHSDAVSTVAFSSEGKSVASGSDDSTVRLWDAATGAALRTLEGHCRPVNTVAFSPDGKSVASGSDDNTVRLWDAATGAALTTLKGHSGSVSTVAFSPDGNSVASGSHDTTVRLWDAASAALHMLEGHSSWVNTVAVSPDGKSVASGSDDTTVRLWDVATGAALQTLEGHSKPVNTVAFSPDGKSVASWSDDRTVRLWDAATGAALQTLGGRSKRDNTNSFFPDGNWNYNLHLSNNWITEETERILLLPPDYRGELEGAFMGIIVLSQRSGRLLIINVKEGPKLI